MLLIHLGPDGHSVLLPQLGQQPVGEDGELLVGGRGGEEGEPGLFAGGGDAVGLLVGGPADVVVEVVLKQRQELQPQQPALGQHAAVLLDGVPEIPLQVWVGDDHRLPQQRAALGAPNVEHVAQPGQVPQGHVAAPGRQAVAQPGAVQKEVQPQLLAGLA